MWTPTLPLAAALVSPITVTAGPLVAYNVVSTAAPALAGWTAYLAFRRWTALVPSLTGALIFGFSPFIAAESADHPFLTFSMTAPLILIVLDRMLVVQRASARWDGLWLGLLVWAQLLISEEVLAIEAILAIIAVTTLALLDVRTAAAKLAHALRGLGMAIGVAGLLSAWPLAVQFLGPDRPTSLLWSPSKYSADLWNFVSPTFTTALYPHSAIVLVQHYSANWKESGDYVGVPLLAFLVIAFILCRRRRVAWAAAAIALSAAVLSLGPTLHLAGRNTGIPLPWSLIQGLPLIKDLLPSRVAGSMFLGVGLLVALGLDELKRRRAWARFCGYGLVGLSLVTLAPMIPYYTNKVPVLSTAGPGTACPTYPGTDVVLLPSSEEYQIFWQTEAGFCFSVPNAPAMNVPASPLKSMSVVDQASRAATGGWAMPSITQAVREKAVAQFNQLEISAILLGPTPTPSGPAPSPPTPPWARGRLARWLTQLIGVPPASTGDVLIWRNPGAHTSGASMISQRHIRTALDREVTRSYAHTRVFHRQRARESLGIGHST
jgi:hypothetical protein